MNKIINQISNQNFSEWINDYDDLYVESSKLHFKQYRGSMMIQDVTNAMKKGLTCVSFTINKKNESDSLCNIVKTNIEDLFSFMSSLEFAVNRWGGLNEIHTTINEIDVIIYKSITKSIRVFSPFSKKEFKPLKSAPAKYTMMHVHKILANGQFENLRCDGHYTDDYAFDAAVDFQRSKNDITDGSALLEDLLERPSGWGVYQSDGKLHIHCHSFLSYSLRVRI